jgi:predicted site-specific integrase-resolvase
MQQFIDQKQLSERLGISMNCLENWRLIGKGPDYYKFEGNVRYRVEDVEKWEAKNKREKRGKL